MFNYPLKFAPVLKVRVWGGNTLSNYYKSKATDPIGESWEICDHDEDVSTVINGELKGKTLRELMEMDKAALLGNATDPNRPDRFPLMLKLLDSQDALSVQVHPDDKYANSKKEGELGKTEAWYILEADEGACIWFGLKKGTKKEEFEKRMKNGTVDQCLNKIDVKVGDVYFMPSGTVHALGPGVRMAEIQQNSDTTFRLFDWNRVGIDGKPRQLHIEDGIAVTDFSEKEYGKSNSEKIEQENCKRELYIKCEKMSFEKLSAFTGQTSLNTEGKTFHILTCTSGNAEVICSGVTTSLKEWETCLIPAGANEYSIKAEATCEILLFHKG
jgi:mannose-6-phosphate isomerase